jgi:hypothetical protein
MVPRNALELHGFHHVKIAERDRAVEPPWVS